MGRIVMKILSLFDGMSCGQIALEKLGITFDGKKNKYYASEIDKYAMQITQKNYPNTIQLGDIRNIKPNPKKKTKIDLIMGGSPCQGFSFAGKQLNFEDPRSKLFFEFVRLYYKLAEINPNIKFLLENVKMKKEYQDVISQYLNVEPIIINSSLLSAQNRVRLYWTNIPNIKQPDDKGIILKDIIQEKEFLNVFKNHRKYKKKFDNSKQGILIQVGSLYKNNGDAGRIYSIQGKGRTLKGEAGGGGAKMGLISKDNGATYRKLTPIECERLQTVPDNYTDGVSNAQRYKMLGNGWTVDVIAHILKNMDFIKKD
jgi:DNA-cytosine methyltransferase